MRSIRMPSCPPVVDHDQVSACRRHGAHRVHLQSQSQSPLSSRPAGGAPYPRLHPDGDGLFDVWRFHAFFTTCDLDTVSADRTHRAHAIVQKVHADLKASALAHLPSGSSARTPPGWCARSSPST
ncbi:hypothetical protein GORHZ_183_00345 [Gordonia rhizosphera NBRC 16068]|uniref:Uncharacterized protein n=1 Tax=Gordonia rhizosphera NBRC 16068 TaxID=1108045 RepID=K6WFM5_9ACTN|nr:hypothetical protein GORHZ_183_00345 [Gordonia rhizosphera NBRC 16068]